MDTVQEFFNDQLQYLDLVYVTAKHKMYCCNKDESPPNDDNTVVVACALVNGCADESKENLQVHYIATKVQYEGLGYASLLIYKLLLYMKKKCESIDHICDVPRNTKQHCRIE